jgi:chromosome segregation ATPase
MAQYNGEGSKAGGALEKVQEIVAQYISELESGKIAESRLAVQAAEEAKMVQSKAEEAVRKANEELEKLEAKKSLLSLSVSKIEQVKEAKQEALTEMDRLLAKKKVEADEYDAKSTFAQSSVAQNEQSMASLEGRRQKAQKESDEINAKLAEQKSAYDLLVSKSLEKQKEVQESEDKVQANKVLSDKLMEENKNLLKEVESLSSDKGDFAQKCVQAEQELVVFLQDIEAKKKVASNELAVSQNEVDGVKKEIALEKESLESERLFIKKMEEINNQKGKAFLSAKDKMKEIITKCIPDLEAERASEFKNLLSVIEKL